MVAMNVWPTDAADGSVASEARWRKMARHWAATGVCPNIGGDLAPSLAGLNLTVRAGACWVDGHFCELLGDQVLAVTANGYVVVRFDPAANIAELVYKDGGTPVQSPTGTFEIPIARMVGSAMTDMRTSLGVPGYVAVPVVLLTNIVGFNPVIVDIAGMAHTFTALPGRYYEVDFRFVAQQQGAAGNQFVQMNMDGAADVIVSSLGTIQPGTLTMHSGTVPVASGRNSGSVPSMAAGTRTVKMRASVSAGTFDMMNASFMNGRFSIKDVGPIT